MKLIDKENDSAFGLFSFGKDGLHSACEFVAGPRALGQGIETEPENAPIAQGRGYITERYFHGHAASDGVTIEIGFAHNHGSLPTSRKALNDAGNVSFVATRGFQLAALGQQTEIRSIF